MTQHTPLHAAPAPTAVPWTPDMMTQTPTQAPVHPQPQHAPQPMAAQPQFSPQPMAQQIQPPQQMPPQHAQPATTNPQAYAPTPPHMQTQMPAQMQGHVQSQVQGQPQTHMVQPQMNLAQQHMVPPTQMLAQPYAQTPAQSQMNTQPHPPQMSPPPLQGGLQRRVQEGHIQDQHGQVQHPQTHAAALAPPQPLLEPAASKSLVAKLLKRGPKTAPASALQQTEAVQQTVQAVESGSLFNKNFALGGLTGLVIGAFIVPMVMGMFAAETPPPRPLAQIEAPALTGDQTALAALEEGQTFVDAALVADAP